MNSPASAAHSSLQALAVLWLAYGQSEIMRRLKYQLPFI